MPLSTDRDIVFADDLLEMPGGDHYEFVHRMPVEKVMGAEAEYISQTIARLLGNHCVANKLGWVFGAKTGYRCFPHDRELVRLPDASFVGAGRFSNNRLPKGFVPIAPELIVEVISPNDQYEGVEGRVNDFFQAGTKLVWIVSPESRSVIIRRPDGSDTTPRMGGALSGEDVIPGFACKVADLFV